jgi:hypothetical protein
MGIPRWSRFGAFGCVVVILIVAAFYAGRASSQRQLMEARGDATSLREALARAHEELERTKAQYEKTLKWERIRLGEEADKWERDKRVQGETGNGARNRCSCLGDIPGDITDNPRSDAIKQERPNSVRHSGCCWHTSSTLDVESLRKTGYGGQITAAPFDPRRLSASTSGELAISPCQPSILNLPTASVGDHCCSRWTLVRGHAT